MPEIQQGMRTEPRPVPKTQSGIGWILIIVITALVLSIILPLLLQLAVKVSFEATSKSEDQWEGAATHVLAGASREAFEKTVSTEYSSSFVPGQLEDLKAHFIAIMVFYGPILITGAPLDISGAPAAGTQDLRTSASIKISNTWVAILFFLIFFILLFVLDATVKDQFAVLKFVITISLFWLGFSLIMWFIGRWMLAPLSLKFNSILTDEQGTATYALSAVNIFAASIRIFLAGSIYWVLSFLFKKARTEPDNNTIAESAKSLHP